MGEFPPDWVQSIMGGWDPSRYRWDPYSQNVVDIYTGGSYSMGAANPNMGSQLVTDLSAFNSSGGTQGAIDLGGATPYFGFGDSAQGYNAGLMPGSGIFASINPQEIADYQSHASDVVNRGVASVGALVGGAAALGGALGGGGASGAVAADGLSPITVGASSLPGGVPAVNAAAFSGAGAIPAISQFPSLAGVADGLTPITTGATRLPGGVPSVDAAAFGGGGGMWDNLLGGMAGNWGPLIGGLLGAIDARNQPNSMTTNQGGTSSSTYGQTLPTEITGPAGEALASLRAMFGQGAPVAGVNPATSAAVSRLQNLGSNPFATGSNINPYLDQVFNTAADSTQNRLASEFAHAGMLNTPGHQGSRSQELQTLAANIYAPGYEAERARQYGAIESNLGRELSSVLPMLTAGDYMRQIEQQQLDAPWLNQQRYMTGLQGLMPFYPGQQTQNTTQTGSVTQPLFNNPFAGFLGGAQLGSLFTRG